MGQKACTCQVTDSGHGRAYVIKVSNRAWGVKETNRVGNPPVSYTMLLFSTTHCPCNPHPSPSRTPSSPNEVISDEIQTG